jgi:hypothetical protein
MHTQFCMVEESGSCDKWVPITMAWCILKFRMEEQSPIWRIAVNILNKQLRTTKRL